MWMHGQGFPKGKGCLKPAYEPIILARKRAPKPELNIDECRIGIESTLRKRKDSISNSGWNSKNRSEIGGSESGRWPANVILDEIAADLLDQQSGVLKSGFGDKHSKTQDKSFSEGLKPISGLREYKADIGGASRFFYCAKASSSERNRGCEQLPLKTKGAANGEKCDNTLKGPGNMKNPDKNAEMHNFHPTVKPLKLMEYLIKLITPKDGVILDPFCGSGTTLVAAKKLGYKAIGIELDPEYCKIAQARVNAQEVQMELPI